MFKTQTRLRILVGYSTLLLVWWIAWITIGDSIWWLGLINHVGIWLFYPLLPCLMLALFRPRRAALLRLLPALAVALLAFGPLLIPRPIASSSERPLRVMNYNILFSNQAIDRLVQTIRSADADVLALQEVQPEQMDVLVRQLSDDYPHHLLAPAHPYGTTAIFSRLPFQEARIVDLQADRPAVLVQVEYQSRSVIVVSAHLLSYGLVWVPWSDIPRVSGQRIAEQNRQARNLIAATQAGPNTSVIVACDCNSPETGGTARILYQAFQSSSHTAGWNTVPLTRPGTQLDLSPNHIEYLFFRGPLRPIAHYHLLDSGGSDHYPFVAEFVISSQ